MCRCVTDVVLVDLRNHGISPHDDDCGVEAMADDLIDTLDDLSLDRATLCGHSLGGKVAMAAALRAPERVARLIVADIAPVTYDAAMPSWRMNLSIMDAMAALPPSVLGSRATADKALAASVGDAGVRAFLLQNLIPDESRWRLNLTALRSAANNGDLAGFPSLPPASAALPVRVIAGARSDYCTTPAQRAAIEHHFPGAEAETVFLEAGHWVHAEKPLEFAASVDSFCD